VLPFFDKNVVGNVLSKPLSSDYDWLNHEYFAAMCQQVMVFEACMKEVYRRARSSFGAIDVDGVKVVLFSPFTGYETPEQRGARGETPCGALRWSGGSARLTLFTSMKDSTAFAEGRISDCLDADVEVRRRCVGFSVTDNTLKRGKLRDAPKLLKEALSEVRD
jgi:hypothetical protein